MKINVFGGVNDNGSGTDTFLSEEHIRATWMKLISYNTNQLLAQSIRRMIMNRVEVNDRISSIEVSDSDVALTTQNGNRITIGIKG